MPTVETERHPSEDPPLPRVTPARAVAVCFAALAIAVVMTWPLATDIGRLGRTENSGDARFAVWNVAWVAHALTTAPSDVFDANIFYPHRQSLAFSEANLGAGVIAIPAWLLTKNALAAHNVVVLIAFAASVVFAWLLVRRLTRDDAASAGCALLFAFCPYVFAHTAHIQLLMVAGIPLCLLAFHRLVDQPSPGRGLALGVALAAQALSCAYYGVSAGLTIGYGTLFYAWSRRLWTSRSFWLAIAIGAVSSVAIVFPFFVPFLNVQEVGFARSLEESRQWSAILRSYLASGANAHAWMLPRIGEWNNAVLFPGYVAVVLGIVGTIAGLRSASTATLPSRFSRDRETTLLYSSVAVLTFWASLGPAGGLYTLFYYTIPVFSFLRAPERMGIVVTLCLAVLAGFAVRALRDRVSGRARAVVAVAFCFAAVLDLNDIPFDWRRAEPTPSAYRQLAQLPRGPVAEFPFYGRRIDFHLHSRYMLNSTVHWQPLVNGYSDHIPSEFRALATILEGFPSRESFDAMREIRVRYITINRGRNGYGHQGWTEIEQRLEPFQSHLKQVAFDGEVGVYEVVSWPK